MLSNEAATTTTTRDKTANRDRMLSRKEVQSQTSLSRSTIYQLISDKDFPSSIRIGTRRVAWWDTEIDNWIQQRIEVARGGGSK